MNLRILVVAFSISTGAFHFQCTAATTIDDSNSYAYGGNIGWINCRGDANEGAVIGEYVCSGFVYSANVGWINFGSGSPTNGIYYQNASSADFGVNQDGLGNLRGYAWGANVGWINFENTGAAKVDLVTGNLTGYAWSANCGWISLSNTVTHVQTDSIQQGALAQDGLPIAWLLSNFGTTNVDVNADPDHDGMSNIQEYLAGTNPNDPTSNLQITAEIFANGPFGVSASLTWNSVPSRFYYIQKAQTLISPTWADSGLGLIAPSAGSTTTGNFTNVTTLSEFYRVTAVRPLFP